MKKELLVVAAGAALLSGCALLQPRLMLDDSALYDQYMTRSFGYSASACYDAVKKTFADNKVALAKDDPESGKMTTEKYSLATFTKKEDGMTQDHQQFIKYWMQVSGDESSCMIKVTKLKAWMDTQELTYVYPEQAASLIWEPLFSSIKDQLEDDND